MNKWNEIRSFYRNNYDAIINEHPMLYGVDPYWWDGMVEMTPIERSMWSDIRCSGVVFYPQYPVLKYFVDFGNPLLKIAIECDGQYWHDKEKDSVRDAEMNSIGWTVYRFTGRDCLKTGIEFEDEHGRIIYQKSNVERLLAKIQRQVLSFYERTA